MHSNFASTFTYLFYIMSVVVNVPSRCKKVHNVLFVMEFYEISKDPGKTDSGDLMS